MGRIWLENADGGVIATAEYAVPEGLREPTLLTPLGLFLQARHQDGHWVYRYDSPIGLREPDATLLDYRSPSDLTWDGPLPTVPRPTFLDVRMAFERAMSQDGPVSVQRIAELYVLVAHAWPEDRV